MSTPSSSAPPAAGGLDFSLAHGPEFPLLTVRLAAGQSIFTEPDAMVTMSPALHMRAALKGGLGKSLGRAFGGESLVVNTFSAPGATGGELALAPGGMGDIHHYRLGRGGGLMLQRGAFLAHGEGVTLDASWQGARGFFSGGGLVMLKAGGAGDLFFNGFGAVIPLDVDGTTFVDTGYVLAFEDTLSYRVTTMPGLRPGMGQKLKTFFLGGEGLVCQFSGRGRVWVQTRQIGSFLGWIYPYRPVKQRN